MWVSITRGATAARKFKIDRFNRHEAIQAGFGALPASGVKTREVKGEGKGGCKADAFGVSYAQLSRFGPVAA
jgi:hypothetical protein